MGWTARATDTKFTLYVLQCRLMLHRLTPLLLSLGVTILDFQKEETLLLSCFSGIRLHLHAAGSVEPSDRDQDGVNADSSCRQTLDPYSGAFSSLHLDISCEKSVTASVSPSQHAARETPEEQAARKFWRKFRNQRTRGSSGWSNDEAQRVVAVGGVGHLFYRSSRKTLSSPLSGRPTLRSKARTLRLTGSFLLMSWARS